MVLLLFKKSRQCLIIQGTAVVLIIQGNIASLLFKDILRPCYSRNLCGVQGIAMLLIKFKDHCSVLVIEGITVVFQLFNYGVLFFQATTVSLLITTNCNT